MRTATKAINGWNEIEGARGYDVSFYLAFLSHWLGIVENALEGEQKVLESSPGSASAAFRI